MDLNICSRKYGVASYLSQGLPLLICLSVKILLSLWRTTCPKTHRIVGPLGHSARGPKGHLESPREGWSGLTWLLPTLLSYKPFWTPKLKKKICIKIWTWKSVQICQLIIIIMRWQHFLWPTSVQNPDDPLWSSRMPSPGQIFSLEGLGFPSEPSRHWYSSISSEWPSSEGLHCRLAMPQCQGRWFSAMG